MSRKHLVKFKSLDLSSFEADTSYVYDQGEPVLVKNGQESSLQVAKSVGTKDNITFLDTGGDSQSQTSGGVGFIIGPPSDVPNHSIVYRRGEDSQLETITQSLPMIPTSLGIYFPYANTTSRLSFGYIDGLAQDPNSFVKIINWPKLQFFGLEDSAIISKLTLESCPSLERINTLGYDIPSYGYRVAEIINCPNLRNIQIRLHPDLSSFSYYPTTSELPLLSSIDFQNSNLGFATLSSLLYNQTPDRSGMPQGVAVLQGCPILSDPQFPALSADLNSKNWYIYTG